MRNAAGWEWLFLFLDPTGVVECVAYQQAPQLGERRRRTFVEGPQGTRLGYAYPVALGFSGPIYPHEISVFLEIVLNLAVEGALDRLANAARQVDVRRVDHDSVRVLLDTNDPVEWMFFLFRFLLMAGQVDHLLLVFAYEITFQGNHTGRKFVVDAAAGRAQRFNSAFD